MSGDFLTQMADSSRARVHAAKQALSQAALAERARETAAPPPLRLDASGFDLVAELKLRSPAAGPLTAGGARLAERVSAYARGGAAAVSVLTEPERFEGSLAHLTAAAAALAPQHVPAMRKDFLVDPYQVLEARVAGAGGVLVILRMLAREQIDALIECAAAHGLFVLLEAFDAQDLDLMHGIVAAHGPRCTLLAGLNCRDLTTLQVVPQRLEQLAALLPGTVPRVAESGVASAADAHRVAAAGYQLALVGSALMQGTDPEALARSLLGAGRAALAAA
jgi:indole-3-glycerol phosphate synthase